MKTEIDHWQDSIHYIEQREDTDSRKAGINTDSNKRETLKLTTISTHVYHYVSEQVSQNYIHYSVDFTLPISGSCLDLDLDSGS